MRVRTVIAALLVAVAIGGFAGYLAEGSGYAVKMPSEPTTVLGGEGPAGLALSTSRALYERAPVVVLAGAENASAQAPAASVAVALGAPLLLVPLGGDSRELGDELDRLGAESVLVFGDRSRAWADGLDGEVEVFQAPPAGGDLEGMTGGPLGERRAVRPGALTDVVANLTNEDPDLLEVARGSDSVNPDPAEELEGESSTELPAHEPSRELDQLTFLANRGRGSAAAAATARAAGARVIVVSNGDPRALPVAVSSISENPPDVVIAALDGDPVSEEDLRRRLELAATGVNLPGGGQVLFPYRRMVALYGHPDTPELGVLGEQSRRQSIERAESLAAEYASHGNAETIGALEIIATIASQSPGEDGDYSIVTPLEELRPWVEQAGRAGVYVVLDLQPGRTDFLTQAQYYEELLTEPHVGLALDPEWRLEDGQVHLEQIGSVDAQEINEVIDWLAALTREHMLPQKLLVLHQFELAMITDRGQIDTSHDELAVLLHADGHGTPELKRSTWDLLTEADQPSDLWWGWKNFYDEDAPMWTPEQMLEVRPPPYFISYQ